MGRFHIFQGPDWYQLNPPPKMAKQQPSPWIDSLLRGTQILLKSFCFVRILKEPTVFFFWGSSENDMAARLGQGDKDGMMPLHWAADRGDLEMVPSPKSTWLLVVGVFRATFFVVIFLGVGDIEKNAIYVWLKELVSHHLLGSEFFLVASCHVLCWVAGLIMVNSYVTFRELCWGLGEYTPEKINDGTHGPRKTKVWFRWVFLFKIFSIR